MTKPRKFSRCKPIQKGNPHEITVHQHVFPAASIWRFQQRERVHLFDIQRGKGRFARSNDKIFCADRAWSQGTETEIMKPIEDGFQEIADRIQLCGQANLDDKELEAIGVFYSLWQARAEHRHLLEQDLKPEGVVEGRNVFSIDEQERLEKRGAFVILGDGTLPMRYANSIIVTLSIYKHKARLPSKSWGLIKASEGEFCVPDRPAHGVIPLTPSLALGFGSPSGEITNDDLADLNRRMFVSAEECVFARDLTKCPGITLGSHKR